MPRASPTPAVDDATSQRVVRNTKVEEVSASFRTIKRCCPSAGHAWRDRHGNRHWPFAGGFCPLLPSPRPIGLPDFADLGWMFRPEMAGRGLFPRRACSRELRRLRTPVPRALLIWKVPATPATPRAHDARVSVRPGLGRSGPGPRGREREPRATDDCPPAEMIAPRLLLQSWPTF